MTARVKGLPEGRYRAREAMAKGLYWVYPENGPERVLEPPEPGVKVKLSKQLANRVGARKIGGESLDEAVCRLLDEFLRASKDEQTPQRGVE
jgi:hypothetical protein